jgi:hypothetical protein
MSGGTVSQSLGGQSSPILATIGGKQYKFGLLTQKSKSALERIIQDRVRNELAVSKQDMSDEEYRLAYGAVFVWRCNLPHLPDLKLRA